MFIFIYELDKDKFMKIKDLLAEDTSGHKRLVSSIINMARKMYGKSPNKYPVERYLKQMEKDTEFYDRIIKKSRKFGKNADNYYWGSIRRRAASHFK